MTFGELAEFPGRETIVMTQTIGDFVSLMNKYRHKTKNEKGEEKKVPLGTFWITSAGRRQYDGGYAFMPQHEEKVVGNRLNLWNGYGVKPIKPDGKSGAAGCDKFLEFMRNVICGGNEVDFDYLRKREAWILQKRMRSETALVLRTKEEGVGKNFYENAMGRLLGNHAMTVTNPAHVVGKFNPHLETLLRLTASEALFVGNHEHRNVLFSLITDPTLTIEPKFAGAYPANNFLNTSILSNSDHVFPASATARRPFIPTLSTDHVEDYAYFNAIDNQLCNEGGYEALLYHLLHEVPLIGFNVRDVPKTTGLAEQKLLSLGDKQKWFWDMVSSGELPGGCRTGTRQCPVEVMFNRYIEHARKQGINRRSIQTEIGAYLRRLLPGLHKSSNPQLYNFKRRGQTYQKEGFIYTFPSLAECREAFTKELKVEIKWEDGPEDWVIGTLWTADDEDAPF